jgi:hypothetical protein
MPKEPPKRLFLLLGSFLLMTVGVFDATVWADPPPWAPAHGYRAKHHRYYYYPAAQVYFDPDRRLYFYSDGRTWQLSAHLPAGITIQVGNHRVIELDTDTPYVYHAEIMRKYPPGLRKTQQGKKD